MNHPQSRCRAFVAVLVFGVASVVDVPRRVWRLEGMAVRDVQCWVIETPSGLVAVRLIHGEETMLDEMYPNIQTAMARTDRLRSDLMKAGWKVLPE